MANGAQNHKEKTAMKSFVALEHCSLTLPTVLFNKSDSMKLAIWISQKLNISSVDIVLSVLL